MRLLHDDFARLAKDFQPADVAHPAPEGLPPMPEIYPDQETRHMGEWLGIWLILAGTLVWGFGDLLGGLPL